MDPETPSLVISLTFSLHSIQTRDGTVKEIGDHIKCYYCNKNHKVDNCEEFQKLSGEEKFKFMRARKLWDNRLSSFHFAAWCRQKHGCTIPGCEIRRKHITDVHDPVVEFEKRHSKQSRVQASRDRRDTPGDQTQFTGLTNQTGTGRGSQALSNLPVKVRAKGKGSFVETYALLDSGSTATFCSTSILKKPLKCASQRMEDHMLSR